jgi:hypothetical protein
METHILEVQQCEQTGEMGLIVQGMNVSNVSEGDLFVMADPIGIAHDLTEHVNGLSEIGTIFDEFQALGGIWYVRGQHADLRRDRVGSAIPDDENVAHDLIRMAEIAVWHGTGGRLNEEPEETDFDETFEWMVEFARPKLLQDILSGEDMTQAEYCKEHEFDIEDYLQQALWGMKLGVHKIEQKYENPFHANNRFWNIYEALTPIFKQELWEGMEFELRIDADNQARCYEHYEDDEEQLA